MINRVIKKAEIIQISAFYYVYLLARDEEELTIALARRRGPVLAATVDSLPGQLAELRAAGVDDFVFSLLGGTWELFVDGVMPRLNAG